MSLIENESKCIDNLLKSLEARISLTEPSKMSHGELLDLKNKALAMAECCTRIEIFRLLGSEGG